MARHSLELAISNYLLPSARRKEVLLACQGLRAVSAYFRSHVSIFHEKKRARPIDKKGIGMRGDIC